MDTNVVSRFMKTQGPNGRVPILVLMMLFLEHSAHHTTHENMCHVCIQFQPVPLGCLNVLGVLLEREEGQECKRDPKEAMNAHLIGSYASSMGSSMVQQFSSQ